VVAAVALNARQIAHSQQARARARAAHFLFHNARAIEHAVQRSDGSSFFSAFDQRLEHSAASSGSDRCLRRAATRSINAGEVTTPRHVFGR
jgi:hypothetical protein